MQIILPLKNAEDKHNGTSAMSSNKVGVQSRITEVSPLALYRYTHCSSHVLILSVASACEILLKRNMTDIINEAFSFFDNSLA